MLVWLFSFCFSVWVWVFVDFVVSDLLGCWRGLLGITWLYVFAFIFFDYLVLWVFSWLLWVILLVDCLSLLWFFTVLLGFTLSERLRLVGMVCLFEWVLFGEFLLYGFVLSLKLGLGIRWFINLLGYLQFVVMHFWFVSVLWCLVYAFCFWFYLLFMSWYFASRLVFTCLNLVTWFVLVVLVLCLRFWSWFDFLGLVGIWLFQIFIWCLLEVL